MIKQINDYTVIKSALTLKFCGVSSLRLWEGVGDAIDGVGVVIVVTEIVVVAVVVVVDYNDVAFAAAVLVAVVGVEVVVPVV